MRKRRLNKVVQRRLIEHFVARTTARCGASLVEVNVKTACYCYHRLRFIISQQLEKESGEDFKGEIDVDERYFGGTRNGNQVERIPAKYPYLAC